MKHLIKKLLAVALTLIIAIGIIPPVEVLANPQNPVHTPRPGGIFRPLLPIDQTRGMYRFELNWVWGAALVNRTPMSGPGGAGPGGIHDPLYFDIEWRNATVPEPFIHTPGDGLVRRDPRQTVDPTSVGAGALARVNHTYEFSGALRSGSIYSFRVVPWHTHTIQLNTDPPSVRIDTVAPSPADMEENLFLTDISVDLTRGEMGGMLITWDNPLFDGNQVFDAYRIYFRQVPDVGTMPGWTPGTTVTPESPGLVRTDANRTWSFEFVHAGLQVGAVYDVRVVPMVGAAAVRQEPGTTNNFAPATININGVVRNFAFSGREFIGTGFSLPPHLSVTRVGQNLRLNWSTPVTGTVLETQIWMLKSPPPPNFQDIGLDRGNAQLIHTIMGVEAGSVTSHLVPLAMIEDLPVWFAVAFRIEPPVPSPPDYTVFWMWTNYVDYDPEIDDFAPYAPTIRSIGVNNPPSLDIQWRAFTRPIFGGDEAYRDAGFTPVGPNFVSAMDDSGREYIIDDNLVFYIYITDSIEFLDNPSLPHVGRVLGRDMAPERIPVVDGPPQLFDWFYSDNFSRYVRSDDVMEADMVGNKVYYIRIVARRPILTGGITGDHESDPSYGAAFIPPTDYMHLIPHMVPVRVKLDDEGIQLIDDDSITIEWNTEWFEVFDIETNIWYDVVATRENGEVVFGRAAENESPARRRRLWDEDDFRPLETANLTLANEYIQRMFGPNVPVRLVNTEPSNISNHLVHVVQYDEMAAAFPGAVDPYAMYLRSIRGANDGPPTPGMWRPIGMGSSRDGSDIRYSARIGSLSQNTSYVIFFWPENENESNQYHSYHPSYTTGTTTDDRDILDIQPPVPVLRVERHPIEGITAGTTDTSITLSWNGSFELAYQLRFTELMVDFENNAGGEIIIDFNSNLESYGIVYRNGRLYMVVDGLFPETLYHFRIQARAQGVAGFNYSNWSNPVSERTLGIAPPQEPSGLRIASSMSLSAYNTENSTEHRTGEPDQLIVEWNRIFADINNQHPPDAAQDGYDTDPGVTSYDATWLDSPSLLSTYMAKFMELIPNRRYHIRVWTVLTVTRGDGPRGIVRSYSYRMQLSSSPDFDDYIQIIIPSLDPPHNSPNVTGQMLRRESLEYHYRSFFSGQTDDEYDGFVNPDLFPLPDRDWELSYDRGSSTLTFRFRSNQIDETGARDHNVDQRFISRLVQQRVFTYRLDLSTYNTRPVQNAVVEMPFSIMRAFHERQISLEVTHGNARVTFTPGSLATAEARSLTNLGPETTTRLIINSADENTPALAFGNSYVSDPRRISAEVSTPQRTINFDQFAQPIQLAFTPQSQAAMLEQNVGMFTATPLTGGWQRVASNHSPTTGELSLSTRRAGSFAAIGQAAPAQTMPMHPSRDAFTRVNSSIAINDMQSFNPYEQVSGLAFNNMVAAIAMGRDSVNMNAQMTQTDAMSLARARMFVAQPVVTREAGVAALVTLYERRVGQTVQTGSTPRPADLASASSSANQLALLKAAELGFIEGNARPAEALTMGDFMSMLDIIIMDME